MEQDLHESDKQRLVRELRDPRNHTDGKVSEPMLEAAGYLLEHVATKERTSDLVKQLRDPANHNNHKYSVYMLEAAQIINDLETT